MSAAHLHRPGRAAGAEAQVAHPNSSEGVARFAVRLQPRASRTAVIGFDNDTLRVRVQAPPVNGAANDALVELLAEWIGVPRRQVRIVSGQTSRSKFVEVKGIDRGDLERLAQSL